MVKDVIYHLLEALLGKDVIYHLLEALLEVVTRLVKDVIYHLLHVAVILFQQPDIYIRYR